jgi:hypothetical protein
MVMLRDTLSNDYGITQVTKGELIKIGAVTGYIRIN